MFPFLKYLEMSVKNRSAGILGQENRKTRMQWCGILPRPIEAGEPSAKSAENPIHGVEDAGDARQTATGALIDGHGV